MFTIFFHYIFSKTTFLARLVNIKMQPLNSEKASFVYSYQHIIRIISSLTAWIKECGKFATGVVDTGGESLTSEYLREYSKKFETVLMGHSGAGRKLIHEAKKSRDTVPLNGGGYISLFVW